MHNIHALHIIYAIYMVYGKIHFVHTHVSVNRLISFRKFALKKQSSRLRFSNGLLIKDILNLDKLVKDKGCFLTVSTLPIWIVSNG